MSNLSELAALLDKAGLKVYLHRHGCDRVATGYCKCAFSETEFVDICAAELEALRAVEQAARKWRDNYDAKCLECDYGAEGAGCTCSGYAHAATEGICDLRTALAALDELRKNGAGR